MARLTREETQALIEKHKVDRIWSWSRISTFLSQPWVYRMQYLEKVKVNTSSVYTEFGTLCHDLVQDMYDGKHKAEDMGDLFAEAVVEWRLDPNAHQFMSDNVEDGYIKNLTHYFNNPEVISYKIKNEQTIQIRIADDIMFVGYADSMYIDEEGVLHLIDFKTSSRGEFTGAKFKKSSRQLLLYAIGVHQMTGLPYNRIKPQFDMMKYIKVHRLQKNGKWRESIQERASWVASQGNQIRKMLSDAGCSIFEIDDYVIEASEQNTLDSLPDYVQDNFRTESCYLDVEISDDIAEEYIEWMRDVVNGLRSKEKGDWSVEFPEPVIDETNQFYFNVLAKGFLEYHEGYQDEKRMKELRGKERSLDDILDNLMDFN